MQALRIIALLLLFTSQALTAEVTPNRTVDVSMRDGEELPTDIFFPKDWDGEPLPCILVRTPRSRTVSSPEYGPLADWGYVVVVQDTRNVVDFDGMVIPYITDEQDGYDTVEWVAEQEFCNGKVGTMGKSALGITQHLMAPSAPEALVCQYITVAAPSLFHHAIFPGGQIRKIQVEGWMGDHSRNGSAMNLLAQHSTYDDFWFHVDAVAKADRINSAGLHYGGWYDTFSQGTIDAFVSRQTEGGPKARGKQKLIMGPWTHSNSPANRKFGDFVLPTASELLPDSSFAKAWFDHHLKGEGKTIEEMPAVTYYVMGPFDGSPSKGNVWKSADQWPVPAEEVEWHLTSELELVEKSPSDEERIFSYIYDRDDPTPTVGGRNLFLEAGPKDQRSIEERGDVIVFTSRPLAEDTEVTGQIRAKILFNSEQLDTDLVLRLTDVYPDGRSILIADGITHLETTLSDEEKVQLSKGEPVEVEVDLWSTSMVFGRGHRIRVSVSSANYPRSEKGLHAAFKADGQVAPSVTKNKLYVGAGKGSRLILPVVHDEKVASL